ncbi:hypothetical protein PIB30_090632 [Stylosanthes scabra]|uniref:BHLH domain-containing protein n=1 Tax=Stylosanthes scabra TaxID=79078 RepID=A0ABU6QTS8_9FABA|nr:hypothetical protein [Stylosanthes scabra]
MQDVRDDELQSLKRLSETLRRQLLHRFATDPGFLKRSAVNKVNRDSSKGGCLHPGGSATIPKTRARMMRSLDRPPTEPEFFREMHTRKRDRSVVEKRIDDLSSFLPTLSKPHKRRKREMRVLAQLTRTFCGVRFCLSHTNQVYGAGGFFASSLHRSGYGGSSASATITHTGPAALEVVDLREQVQNLKQSLETQRQVLQQHIDEVQSLKDTLAERDARTEEHLRRMEEMQRQMAAFYNSPRPGSNTAVGGSGSSTAPPLPTRPPRQQPDHPPADDDDDYEDA